MMEFNVKLSNISVTHKQTAWNYLTAVPKELGKANSYGKIVSEDGKSFPAAVVDGEFFARVEMTPWEQLSMKYISDDSGASNFPPHEISDWIVDQPEKLLPKFVITNTDGRKFESAPTIFWDGKGSEPLSYFKIESFNSIRMRFYFKTLIIEGPFHITGWFDVYTKQDAVPFCFNFQYGNVSVGDFQKSFGSLSMITGEKPTVDWWKRKGLHAPIWRSDLNSWETQVVSPRQWRKSRTIEVYGALLCMPDYASLGKWADTPGFEERINNLKAREEGPICAFVDEWTNRNLAFRVIPQKSANWQSEDRALQYQMFNGYNIASDEYAPRPQAQPPNSGQTGEQPDFGASKIQSVMSNKNPWAIWEYRFQAQAWKLRPYAHRESNGSRVLAENHPEAKNYNMRPDDRFNKNDRLGWFPPIPYFEDWTASDNQHRSDNLLLGIYQITNDPSLRDCILDIIENQQMELDITELYPDDPIGAPRSWGRQLMSMAHIYSLGFTEVLPIMNKYVDYLFKNSSMRRVPPSSDRTVRVLSDNGSKYGWLDTNNQPIRAWVCWEESIAAMGLWAVWKITGNTRAKSLALDIGRTITKHAFFKSTDNRWYAAYCVRWDVMNPGKPLPQSAYNLNPNNKDVFVYGMQTWLIPSLKILISESPEQDPDVTRAKEIIQFFGAVPPTHTESGWWAVV